MKSPYTHEGVTPLVFYRHWISGRNDSKIAMLDNEFGDHIGYAMYFKLLEVMTELQIAWVTDDDKAKRLYARMMGIESGYFEQFLEKCVEFGLLKPVECPDGVTRYESDKLNEFMAETFKNRLKARESSLIAKAKREASAAKDKPPPKKPKPKKDPAPEIPPETKKQIAELRGYVQNMIDEYPDSKNGKNDLTDAQYVRLLDKYGRDKLVEMQKVFFEWKLAKSEKVKTTDYGTLIRDTGWVSTQADENINANKSLAQDEPLKPGEWRHPFPKPDGWEDMGFMEQTSYLRDKRKAIIAEGGTL